MFDDHLVRKKAFLDYKNICFTQLQYFSQTGKPIILVKKMENSSRFDLGQIRPRNNVWYSPR